jgi:hypothetical protein
MKTAAAPRELLPKGAVEQELGSRLPEGVRVVAVDETQDTIHLVLPDTPTAGREGEALSHQHLERVAGGGSFDEYTGEPETCVVSVDVTGILMNDVLIGLG